MHPSQHGFGGPERRCEGDPGRVSLLARVRRVSAVEPMDARTAIRGFVASRRAKLKAGDIGLPDYGIRRVPPATRGGGRPGRRQRPLPSATGARRPGGASDSVLEALARALQLDEAERAHLFDLARAAQPMGPPPRRRPARQRIRPSVQQLLEP